MSQFNANIVVQPIESTLVVEQNSINLTPSDVQLNVFGTGPRGYAGSAGVDGSFGYTGSKGDPDGYTGSIGFTGSRGDPGGYTGSAGTIGVDGFVGSIGAQGPQGPFGFTGSKGDPDGYTGSIGPQGPKGDPDGYTGSIGPQGPIGYTGSVSSYIENGTSNVNIPVTDGNITFGVSGTSNVVVVANTGTQFNNLNLLKFGETVVNVGNVSGTITPNAAAGTIYKYTLIGNITLNTITNVVAGTSMTIMLQQDNVGGRNLTSTWKYAGNSKSNSLIANSVDVISVFYDGSEYYAVLTKGYA